VFVSFNTFLDIHLLKVVLMT